MKWLFANVNFLGSLMYSYLPIDVSFFKATINKLYTSIITVNGQFVTTGCYHEAITVKTDRVIVIRPSRLK